MKTSELLHLQALKFKRQVLNQTPDFEHDDQTPAWMRHEYDANGGESRNICAMIPLSLFDEIQRLSGLLSISKRRMVEIALRDLAISSNKALGDVGFDAASLTYRAVGEVPSDEA